MTIGPTADSTSVTSKENGVDWLRDSTNIISLYYRKSLLDFQFSDNIVHCCWKKSNCLMQLALLFVLVVLRIM